MSTNQGSVNRRSPRALCKVVRERLKGTDTDLTSFFFNRGANFYAFSYEKNGQRRHTLVDTGDNRYREQMLPILAENDINPSNIERIIITHRHPDHCGLYDLLARDSGARLLVHPNFKALVDGQLKPEERGWLSRLDISRLKEHDIEYLPQPDVSPSRNISGLNFPILGGPIEVGTRARLEILGCPESTLTHSPDQIIVVYSPRIRPQTHETGHEDFRPADDIIFAGDLWLMRGPLHGWSISDIYQRLRYRSRLGRILTLGKGASRRVHREQDSEVKEALKRGFSLIRVKPGHGEEFIGSRIIPQGLLADRDLLIELEHLLDADESVLKERDPASKIAFVRERAYGNFVQELLFWAKSGYSSPEIVGLLVRLYQEQSGGDRGARRDRKQRRERLKVILRRLSHDEAQSQELHQLAESTLLELRGVS